MTMDKNPVSCKPQQTEAPLPLTILTGFLGAGKTTILNKFLKTEAGRGSAVLVNEFGEIDVDGAVLNASMDGGGKLLSLPNGCICCEVQEDLASALVTLAGQRREDGIVRGVIETTGLADPGAILRGVAHDPRLRSTVKTAQTICVASAPKILEQTERFAEAAEQITLADRIIVSKTDLMPKDEVSRIADELSAGNPLAHITSAAPGEDPSAYFVPPPVHAGPPPAGPHRHTHGIKTFSAPLPFPLDPDLFRDVLSYWIMRHAENLLRVKGAVRFAGESKPQLVNIVHDVCRIEPLDNADPDAVSALVFIGLNLPDEEIRADLARCRTSV